MTLHWSNAIPQAMQQHGSPPKRLAEIEPPPSLDATLEILSTLDKPGAFTTSPAFAPKVANPT
jgi:hypothetical protein